MPALHSFFTASLSPPPRNPSFPRKPLSTRTYWHALRRRQHAYIAREDLLYCSLLTFAPRHASCGDTVLHVVFFKTDARKLAKEFPGNSLKEAIESLRQAKIPGLVDFSL